MSLSSRLVFSLFVINNIGLLLVTGVSLRFKYSVSLWRKCGTLKYEFLVLRNIPIQKCIFECHMRGWCLAVKFLTIRRECGLVEKGVNMATEFNIRPCVFIRMADVKNNISIPNVCKDCSANQVCNIRNKTCAIQGCERLTVSYAGVLGNKQNVGSKVKIVPHPGYILHQHSGATRCNSSGHWENVPEAKTVACHMYGSDYIMIKDHALIVKSLTEFNGISLSGCKVKCSSIDGCRSFNFVTEQHLCTIKPVAGKPSNYHGIDHYLRKFNCR